MGILSSRNITGGIGIAANPLFTAGLSNWTADTAGTSSTITAISGGIRFVHDGSGSNTGSGCYVYQLLPVLTEPFILYARVKYNTAGKIAVFGKGYDNIQLNFTDYTGSVGETKTLIYILYGIRLFGISAIGSSFGGATNFDILELDAKPLQGGIPTQKRFIQTKISKKIINAGKH